MLLLQISNKVQGLLVYSILKIEVQLHRISHITNHAGPSVWADMPERQVHIGIIYLYSNSNKSSYLFSLKNSRPCRDLNPGPPRYQADMLPIELSWLGL